MCDSLLTHVLEPICFFVGAQHGNRHQSAVTTSRVTHFLRLYFNLCIVFHPNMSFAVDMVFNSKDQLKTKNRMEMER